MKNIIAILMLFLAYALLMLMAVPAGTSKQQTGPKPQDAGKPGVPYWHVWTDENGVSHQDRCELTNGFKYESIAQGAAPSWVYRLGAPAKRIVVMNLPAGWVGEWHENPEPQWIVPLSGRWFVETMDGHRVEMGPGELSFGNDQNTKPDALGRKGHRSGTVGDQPCTILMVQVDQKPVNCQPCQLKYSGTWIL